MPYNLVKGSLKRFNHIEVIGWLLLVASRHCFESRIFGRDNWNMRCGDLHISYSLLLQHPWCHLHACWWQSLAWEGSSSSQTVPFWPLSPPSSWNLPPPSCVGVPPVNEIIKTDFISKSLKLEPHNCHKCSIRIFFCRILCKSISITVFFY